MNASTINPEEVAKFEAMAAEWWNPDGKFKPLHKFNPTRLDYIITHICTQFNRLRSAPDSLKGVNILDIGCGGGLLCEPLTRLEQQSPALTSLRLISKLPAFMPNKKVLTLITKSSPPRSLSKRKQLLMWC